MSNLKEHEAEQDRITAKCEAGTCDHPECHEDEGYEITLKINLTVLKGWSVQGTVKLALNNLMHDVPLESWQEILTPDGACIGECHYEGPDN